MLDKTFQRLVFGPRVAVLHGTDTWRHDPTGKNRRESRAVIESDRPTTRVTVSATVSTANPC